MIPRPDTPTLPSPLPQRSKWLMRPSKIRNDSVYYIPSLLKGNGCKTLHVYSLVFNQQLHLFQWSEKCHFLIVPVIPCRCCCFFKRRKRKTLQRHKWKKRAENLKYCGHCQVLIGSNYTAPPSWLLSPLSLSTSPLSPLFLSHYTHRHRTSSPLCALSRSQCSLATGRLKECCGPADSTTDSWFLYQ